MGFVEVLTLVFIVLKLLGVFNYSWWFVFAPMIVCYTVLLVISFFIFGVINFWAKK